MASKNKEWKEQYKASPIRKAAKEEFKASNKNTLSENNRKYACQVMATIGQELEQRFPGVNFDNENCQLFGRQKSESSIKKKIKLFSDEFDTALAEAIKSDDPNPPTKIRPIYDFYAIKFVCPNVNVENVLKQVKSDMGRFARKADFKEKLTDVRTEAIKAAQIEDFLNRNSAINMDSITYTECYRKIIDCYSYLSELAYDGSYEELDKIAKKKEKAERELLDLKAAKQADKILPKDSQRKYKRKLNKLFKEVSEKRTNKLDLSVGDLMIYDIINTSPHLKNLEVTCSNDPTRTKKKRRSNGYIANFYSFDTAAVPIELQLQSSYRYKYGESGPAAHEKMDNGIKRRKPIPKKIKNYKKFKNKSFKSVPMYFEYLGSGYVRMLGSLENSMKYYNYSSIKDKTTGKDAKKAKRIKKYANYVINHNPEELAAKSVRFPLGMPSVLENGNNLDEAR